MKRFFPFIFSFLFVWTTLHAAGSESVLKKYYTVKSIRSAPQILEGRQYIAEKTNPLQPVIDGKLDDPVWEEGLWESGFIQSDPYEGQSPSQQTAFKILYDGKNIFVAIKAFDEEPDKIERRLARRDNLEGDRVSILMDSYFDHRTAFSFSVNAAGVKGDAIISDNGQGRDQNWDPIWYVKTDMDTDGWTAEMRIPLSQLRYGKKQQHVWGLQVNRFYFRKEEMSNWQLIPKDVSGFVDQFGELHGISGIESSRKLELYPYTVGMLESYEKESGNPFASGRDSSLVGGVDGKIGITSDLTLDFTINPDFGQVEADPSEVNLSAFETYFEEKRPFFIEGRSIMSFQVMIGDGDLSSDNLFYSRRIGRSPNRRLNSKEDYFVDMPPNTSILGAFKLTGKTKNGLSIGIIDGVTSQENARIFSLGMYSDEPVEPLTNYFGARLQKDFNQGNTIIGGMLTSTNRSLSDQELSFLHNSAYTGGIDFYHTWKDKTYFLSFNAVFSRVQGTKDAIIRTQTSPLRYFQRPDADHIELDPNRTSLSGHGGTLIGGKLGSGHFQFITGVTWRSPGLELNDMGYLRNADSILEFVWANYRIWEPFSVFRQLSVNGNQWRGWNFGGERAFAGGNIGINGQFQNYWSFSTGINHNAFNLSDSALRGGPALVYPGTWGGHINLTTDSRKKIRFTAGWSTTKRRQNDSPSNAFILGLNVNPSKAISVMIQPVLSFSVNDLQYVDQFDFDLDKRYIFARIDQKTFGMTIRFNFSLTPDLSIQFYGQPFISSGKYTDFKRITFPRAEIYSDRFHVFGGNELAFDQDENLYSIDENRDGETDYVIADPNFKFLQFRSNLVIRWEYKPGSSFYLVWSQGRTGYMPYADATFMSNMQELFEVYPHDVFLIKFSYGFNL